MTAAPTFALKRSKRLKQWAESAASSARTLLLKAARYDSIRNRILAFAFVATLLPSGLTIWFAYGQARLWVEEKIKQDLVSESFQTARATGVWLREQLFDLRVFATSEVVANSVERGGAASRKAPNNRLRDYLVSLNARFGDYGRITVIDLAGHVLATSKSDDPKVGLPGDWVSTLRADGQVVGPAFWVAKSGKAKVTAAVPVKSSDGRLLGAVLAELDLTPMEELLRTLASDTAGAIYIVASNGTLVSSSNGVSPQRRARIPLETLDQLRTERDSVLQYTGFVGRDVIGVLQQVPQADWSVLAEVSSDAAFRELRRLRNIGLAFVAVLLLAAGLVAYALGIFIVRPLDRLTHGVAEVAAGDLQVDLPAGGGAEVGYLTTVFNHMVARLREGRLELDAINTTLKKKNEELERLSVTDGLTGLANHRHLIQRLIQEGMRADATGGEFAVLMADVDHFKQYNDEFGHPAGDEVLKRVADLLRESVRDIDCAARYGGEEFAIVMPEMSADEAGEIAQQIGKRVAAQSFPGRAVTLSIGVAGFPQDADLPHAVIAAADRALYQAKREGRNRTVQANPKRKTPR
ncbi:MAG TPA: diguanylate cyclase [Gemmatimonadaceae bacterium]|nr:diguanylate cyclase [Gemmatimonadaceae bacterium]